MCFWFYSAGMEEGKIPIMASGACSDWKMLHIGTMKVESILMEGGKEHICDSAY